MINVSSARSFPWVGIAVLSVIAVVALLIAVLNPTIAGLAALLGLLLLALGAIERTARRSRVRAASARGRIAGMPRNAVAQRTIVTPAGDTQPALVVPARETDVYQFVLTVDGYQLIDETGRQVYKLK